MGVPELTAVYECADGRPFPVRWANADEATGPWYWDPEHNPAAVAPMDAVVWLNCTSGTSRARVECGFAATDVFIGGRRGRYFNGFNYYRPGPPTDEEKAMAEAANARLRAEYGNPAAFWQRWCQPRAARAVQRLREATGTESIADLLEVFGYGFEQTFLMWGIYDDHPQAFLKEEMGDEAERLAAELTRGYPNATLEADQALWELAQDAKERPAVRAVLLRDKLPSAEELSQVEGGADFAAAFARYLDYYGWRTIDWDVSGAMIRERPEISLRVLRRTIVDELPQPAERVSAAAEAREALVAELEARFAADPDKLAKFREGLMRLSGYLGVKEGRALWQLSLCGALRHALLLKGEGLVAAGKIADGVDILYLLPDEIEGTPSAGDLTALVFERRAERERWSGVTPPAQLGGDSVAEASTAPAPAELRGTAASHGTFTGRARVLSSFEEYERLLPGEVLVCATTTPAWTPLFAVAGALVTDGGGLLSHPAIAAREYGIPAVVGVRAATKLIADGVEITVDGTAGTVTIIG